MSRSIEFRDDVYARLEAAASAAGTTPAEWIEAAVAGEVASVEKKAAAPRPPASAQASALRTQERPGSAPSPVGSVEAPVLPLEVQAKRFRALVARAASGRCDLSARHSELFGEGLDEQRKAGRL